MRKALFDLLQLLRPYRWQLVVCIFLSFLPAYFTVWSPFLLGRLIDQGVVGGDEKTLFLLGGLILFSKLFQFLASLMVNYCLSAFGLQILVDYRDQLLQKILQYPMSFFDRMSSGKITTRLTSDINSLQELFSSALVPLLGSFVLLVGVTIGMLLINWQLALASLLIVPLLVGATLIFHNRIRRRFGFMRQAVSFLNSFSAESFSGSRDIQVLGAHKQNLAEFDRYSLKLKNRNIEAVREYAYYNPLVPFTTSIMDIIILVYGSWRIIHGEMSVGDVVAFLAYASHFGYPIREFAEKYTVFQQAMASVERLSELASHDIEVDSAERIYTPGDISFENVSFTYPGSDKPALSKINFNMRAGEKIAFLGETGSGKTTTCSLLMRFYLPQEGVIKVGGTPIQEFSLDSMRSQMGWVSQDVILFSRSLRENIRFHSQDILDEQIWSALEFVQLGEWARDLPRGLDEVLSERGTSISSGQRQLISLARALVRKPKILIFDEATAYVDSRTERVVQEALEKLWRHDDFKSMTTFIIAHRLSTLRRCDRMVVFKNGSIVEVGTYTELVKKGGYAAALYNKQTRETFSESFG